MYVAFVGPIMTAVGFAISHIPAMLSFVFGTVWRGWVIGARYGGYVSFDSYFWPKAHVSVALKHLFTLSEGVRWLAPQIPFGDRYIRAAWYAAGGRTGGVSQQVRWCEVTLPALQRKERRWQEATNAQKKQPQQPVISSSRMKQLLGEQPAHYQPIKSARKDVWKEILQHLAGHRGGHPPESKRTCTWEEIQQHLPDFKPGQTGGVASSTDRGSKYRWHLRANDLPLVINLCGPAGMGKTELALDVARKAASTDVLAGRVLYAQFPPRHSGNSTSAIMQVQQSLLEQLGVPEHGVGATTPAQLNCVLNKAFRDQTLTAATAAATAATTATAASSSSNPIDSSSSSSSSQQQPAAAAGTTSGITSSRQQQQQPPEAASVSSSNQQQQQQDLGSHGEIRHGYLLVLDGVYETSQVEYLACTHMSGVILVTSQISQQQFKLHPVKLADTSEDYKLHMLELDFKLYTRELKLDDTQDSAADLLKCYLPALPKERTVRLLDECEGNMLAVHIIGQTLSECLREESLKDTWWESVLESLQKPAQKPTPPVARAVEVWQQLTPHSDDVKQILQLIRPGQAFPQYMLKLIATSVAKTHSKDKAETETLVKGLIKKPVPLLKGSSMMFPNIDPEVNNVWVQLAINGCDAPNLHQQPGLYIHQAVSDALGQPPDEIFDGLRGGFDLWSFASFFLAYGQPAAVSWAEKVLNINPVDSESDGCGLPRPDKLPGMMQPIYSWTSQRDVKHALVLGRLYSEYQQDRKAEPLLRQSLQKAEGADAAEAIECLAGVYRRKQGAQDEAKWLHLHVTQGEYTFPQLAGLLHDEGFTEVAARLLNAHVMSLLAKPDATCGFGEMSGLLDTYVLWGDLLYSLEDYFTANQWFHAAVGLSVSLFGAGPFSWHPYTISCLNKASTSIYAIVTSPGRITDPVARGLHSLLSSKHLMCDWEWWETEVRWAEQTLAKATALYNVAVLNTQLTSEVSSTSDALHIKISSRLKQASCLLSSSAAAAVGQDSVRDMMALQAYIVQAYVHVLLRQVGQRSLQSRLEAITLCESILEQMNAEQLDHPIVALTKLQLADIYQKQGKLVDVDSLRQDVALRLQELAAPRGQNMLDLVGNALRCPEEWLPAKGTSAQKAIVEQLESLRGWVKGSRVPGVDLSVDAARIAMFAKLPFSMELTTGLDVAPTAPPEDDLKE